MTKIQKLTFPISELPVSSPFPSLEKPFTLKPVWVEIKDSAKADKDKFVHNSDNAKKNRLVNGKPHMW